MAKKKVYVCFDYERDKHFKFLMEAWDANPNFEFSFNDQSPREIQSDNIPTIKGVLSKKIREACFTVVLAGKDLNKIHPDSKEIGYVNWQNFEIARSVEYGNKLVIVKLPDYVEMPVEAMFKGAVRVGPFSQNNIIKGLEEAANK